MNKYNKLYFLLLKKLIKSGKTLNAVNILNKFFLLNNNREIFSKKILSLIIPLSFKFKRAGTASHKIPNIIHLHKTLTVFFRWFIIASKKNTRKLPFFKSLNLELSNIQKKQGFTYNNRKEYVKNTVFKNFCYK